MGISPKQWDRVKELYETALECRPTQRTAFLQHKEQDEVVREEVLRLLAEYDTLGNFLSTPPFIDPYFNPAQSEKRFAPGETLAARFCIVEFIAAGGMGEVYKAEDTRLDRIVALKFLPEELAEDRQALEGFRREAKAASSLNHPNICTIYDFGEDEGKAFIAMEYLEGETLSSRIKKGPVPLEEAFKIALAVSSALTAAHRKGIVHRDLTPGNIMLTDTGAKLLDFGLAKYERRVATDEKTNTVPIGESPVVGTLPYMSPEQLQGNQVDARGDVFAFGAVLYEMLTGRKAFQRQFKIDTIAAVDREEPKPLCEFVKNMPDELQHIIRRCLRKHPEDRYVSMLEIERELEVCCALNSEPVGGINLRVFFRQTKRPRVAIPLLLILLTLGSLSARWLQRSSRTRWARDQAVPQIARLIELEKLGEAYALAVQAERYISDDPTLGKFWPAISWSGSINTTPSGVSVFRRNYNASDDTWELVGRTPIEKRRFPLVDSRWKFELKTFATVERATFPSDSITVTMDQEGKAAAGMARVEFPTSASVQSRSVRLYGLPGLETLPAIPLGDYWIDKYEVTNAKYKQFLNQGGYQKHEYWKQEFRKNGRVFSWAEAMKLFHDKTGRPGPATWIGGDYPPGQDDYPVTGLSWFEAAAYADFAHKSLPTIYHWTAAASPTDGASILPASNFGGSGTARVGQYQGMSWTGAFDMAGNVKEWISNKAISGDRYIMGGAWNEPTYMFYDADARSPFERSANFGFRCAKYDSTGAAAKAADPVTFFARNFSRERPVSDRLFQVYKSLYSYDKTTLNAVVESVQETEDWKQEKVTFSAAYGGERIIAYLFLPKTASPPFQTVVYFPGANAVRTRSNSISSYLDDFDFIIRSGRAVMFPVYKATFERGDGLMATFPNTTRSYRDHVIAWSKDLGRSIDYLETRQDIDHNKLAYEGYSWGAAMGSLLPAVEDRLKALVLVAPGFYLQKPLPEADQFNFAPRVKVPVLMLNGRFDFIFPLGTSQEPMFRLLGTPKKYKRHIVYENGHDIPRNEQIKETLNWLDRYLGPVK
jgi:serine/threonine protein kinase/cephalosporin-C deacetylase-like acetyl esterase